MSARNVCTQCLHGGPNSPNQCQPVVVVALGRVPRVAHEKSLSTGCPKDHPYIKGTGMARRRESGSARTAHWRMHVEILVRPSASEAAVGGEHDGALIVRVVEPADAGRATDAALRAVAKAIAVPSGSVSLVRGATSRRKLIEIDVASDQSNAVALALQRLRHPHGTDA